MFWKPLDGPQKTDPKRRTPKIHGYMKPQPIMWSPGLLYETSALSYEAPAYYTKPQPRHIIHCCYLCSGRFLKRRQPCRCAIPSKVCISTTKCFNDFICQRGPSGYMRIMWTGETYMKYVRFLETKYVMQDPVMEIFCEVQQFYENITWAAIGIRRMYMKGAIYIYIYDYNAWEAPHNYFI